MVREIGKALQGMFRQRTIHKLQVMPKNTFFASRKLMPKKMQHTPLDQVRPQLPKMHQCLQLHQLPIFLCRVMRFSFIHLTLCALLISFIIEDMEGPSFFICCFYIICRNLKFLCYFKTYIMYLEPLLLDIYH